MSRPTRSDVAPALTPANGPPASEATDVAPRLDPVSPFCREVLALFAGPLADVRFPDVDRAALETLAGSTCEAQRELEALEAALELARGRVLDAQGALTDRAARALAYARVFAAGQPALEDAVAAVRAPAARPTGRTPAREPLVRDAQGVEDATGEPSRRRGRARREQTTEALLPMALGDASAE